MKTKTFIGCAILIAVFMAGSWSGFILGVEAEKEDVIKRSVSMGDCKLVFND